MKFDGFCDLYNRCNNNTRKLCRKRLSEAYFYFKTKQFLFEINYSCSDIHYFNPKKTEQFLETNLETFQNFFVQKWTKIHKMECGSLNCHDTGKLIL